MEPRNRQREVAGARSVCQAVSAAESQESKGGEEALKPGVLLTAVVVVGIILYRLVWASARERRRQYPKRVK